MLNIEKKIEEIRQKPEHIRLRYTWGAVSVCMVAVLTIWFVSMKVNFANLDDDFDGTVSETKNQFDILESDAEFQETQETAEIKEEVKDEYVGDDLKGGSDSSSIDQLLEEARKSDGEGVVR